MEQVNQAVLSINEAGDQSVSGTRQVEREVEHLQALALDLKHLFEASRGRSLTDGAERPPSDTYERGAHLFFAAFVPPPSLRQDYAGASGSGRREQAQ